jgi:hypothetical protein
MHQLDSPDFSFSSRPYHFIDALTKLVMEAWTAFVQILILVVITYWSLDLSGRFWYIVAVLFLYAILGSSLGVLLASATKVRMHPTGEGLQSNLVCRERMLTSLSDVYLLTI